MPPVEQIRDEAASAGMSEESERQNLRDSNGSSSFDALSLFNSVKDSVVDLTAVSHWGLIPTGFGSGKGFYIADPYDKSDKPSCLIVTDNHVIGDDAWLSARTNDGKVPNIEVDYIDKTNDLAFLRVTDKGAYKCPRLDLANAKSESSDRELSIIARAGDSNPRKYYYVQPMMSAPRSRFGAELREGEDPSRQWIALSGAGGAPGDSGAPYINREGKVAGIVVAGTGWRVFATPAADINQSLLKRHSSRNK